MLLPIRDDNPARSIPVFVVTILFANTGIFVYAKLLGQTGFDAFASIFGAIPFELTNGVDAVSPTPIPLYLTLATSTFLHGGWLHLASNMLYLWIFGNNIEDVLGHFRFVAFYFFCGVLATVAHVVMDPGSMIPLVGASGAIAGILGAYVAAFPGARVHTLMFLFVFVQVIRVPAVIVLGVWFIGQLLNASLSGGVGGGVAWYAHIAGFVVGFFLMRRRLRRIPIRA